MKTKIQFALIMLALFIFTGCEKDELKGYEKIVGAATINDQNYKEATWWAWNFKGYPWEICLYENYKIFHFIARLSPEKNDNPSYTINFFVSEDDIQFKTNHPYKIDFYKKLDVKSLYWGDVISYFSENRDEVLMEGADGIAYAKSGVSEELIPLKGELVLESIKNTGLYTNVCFGHYSFTSSGDGSEKLVINGKFEAPASIISFIF